MKKASHSALFYLHAFCIIMRLTLSLCLLLFIASCKKNDTQSANLAEQNLSNLSYGNDGAQKMDVYLPANRNADSTKLIVLVHGGAWSFGDKTDFTPDLPIIKQRLPGYAIANINYRLATASTNLFPAQENDMKAALNYLVQKRSEYKISDKTVLLGVSSGGQMAMLQAYKNASPKISAVVNFFGPADMVALYNNTTDLTTKLGIQILMGGTPATNAAMYQQSSPINFITAQTPPTLILHGDKDNIVDVSQATALKAKLQSVGVTHELYIYPNVGHDIWPAPIMLDAYARIENFIKANVK